MAQIGIGDFLHRPTAKWRFSCVMHADESLGDCNQRLMAHEKYVSEELGVDHAIEQAIYGFRLWLDDEDAATAFALYSSWPVREFGPIHKYIENIRFEVKFNYDDFYKRYSEI